MKKVIALLGSVLLVLGLSQAAGAGTVSFNLTSDHCTGSCGPAGTVFGVVTLTDSGAGSTSVHVNVTLNGPYLFIDTGAADALDFSLLGHPAIFEHDITTSDFKAGTTAGGAANVFPIHADGTGYFMYSIQCATGCSGGSDPKGGPLDFDVTLGDGGIITVSSFIANAAGSFFAVDIYNSAKTGTGAGNTGAVDAPNVNVPDGGVTSVLLGMALLGLAGLRRRLK